MKLLDYFDSEPCAPEPENFAQGVILVTVAVLYVLFCAITYNLFGV